MDVLDQARVKDVERADPEIERPEPPNAEDRRLVERVAQTEEKGDLPVEEQIEALDYLLAAFDREEAPITDRLRVNVGSPQHPKFINWEISSLPGSSIRKIREQAVSLRGMRRTGGGSLASQAEALFMANVRIVVEGTMTPNIREAAAARQVADPGEFLQMALEYKQGLIDQIANEIINLSGFDDDDVQDAEVRAGLG
jgi:Phage XkdN-like tail assembly chaperone protein, TAC